MRPTFKELADGLREASEGRTNANAIIEALERAAALEAKNERLLYACKVAATAEVVYEGGIMDAEAIMAIQETARAALKGGE